MSVVHIASPEGKREVYPEDQVQDIWQRGLIPEASLYWQPGMVDWRPVNEYFHQRPGTGREEKPREGFTFIKDPEALTSILKVMLWVCLAVELVSLFSDWGQLRLAHSGSLDKVSAEQNDTRQALVGLLNLVTLIATGVVFLKWIYWANRNSRGFGAEGMKFTPGWAVGYYFIPILWLFRPYQSMKEIWQVSGDPKYWRTQGGTPLLGWWWGLWLLANFSAQISLRLSLSVHSPEELAVATVADIASSLIHIPLTLVAIKLVTEIYERQKALVGQAQVPDSAQAADFTNDASY